MTQAEPEAHSWEQWPGKAYPLGATYDGSGTNFAIFSEIAERIELCLFDDNGVETRVSLLEVDGFVWHSFLPEVQPGQRYGYRQWIIWQGPWYSLYWKQCDTCFKQGRMGSN